MRTVCLVLALGVWLSACGTPPAEEPASRYELRGRVVATDRQQGTITLEHDAIPGFMPAMTMPFNVRDAWVFDAATDGAVVRAALVVQGGASWLEEVVVSTPADSSPLAEMMVELPEPGSLLPDVILTDQDALEFEIAALRGRWLALTFIYTRCPLPDFCPRMSEQFRAIHVATAGSSADYGDPLLVSVSVDPAFDTPAVLREYGLRYLGNEREAGFARWRFARAEPEALLVLARFSGLRAMPDKGEVVHNLRTLLVDPEGRVVTTFAGNTWTADELLEALAAAVAAR